jgi:uncharacterized protein YdhG (YjbR/CyaY superfamily)
MPRRRPSKVATSTKRRRTSTRRVVVPIVADYLARVPGPARGTLISLRAAIRSALPRDVTETISYRMPAFKRDGVLVWYAAFADHCSLFPGGSVLQRFKSDVDGYKTSKGTIQFALDKPLPIALIKRIVNARVAEHEARKGR